MTLAEFRQQTNTADSNEELVFHAWLTRETILNLLARCEEVGAGPDHTMVLYLAPIDRVSVGETSKTCWLYTNN
jgi:hypothetical protein